MVDLEALQRRIAGALSTIEFRPASHHPEQMMAISGTVIALFQESLGDNTLWSIDRDAETAVSAEIGREFLPDTGPCEICGSGLPASHRVADAIIEKVLAHVLVEEWTP